MDIGSLATSLIIHPFSFVFVTIAVCHSSTYVEIILPLSVKNGSICKSQSSRTMLLVVFPITYKLSIRLSKSTSSLFTVSYPITLIIFVFTVIVCPPALLVSIHPLSLVYNILSLIPHRFSQQSSLAMRLALLKLPSVLQISSSEVVDTASFNILPYYSSSVNILVWKYMLDLSSLPIMFNLPGILLKLSTLIWTIHYLLLSVLHPLS